MTKEEKQLAELRDYLASEINKWIKKNFATWMPMPHQDDFNKWAEQFRAGEFLTDEFYGLVCGLTENHGAEE